MASQPPAPKQAVRAPLQALLFDVDGTLAETEAGGHRPAYNLAFAEMGLDWRWDPALYRELLAVNGGRERLDHYLRRYDPPLGRHVGAAAADRRGWIDSIHRLKTRFFRERLAAGAMALRPGVARLMRAADANGCAVALVTNASRTSLDLMITHLLGPELRPLIAVTACGDEVAAKKPAPDLYLVALRKLGLRPEQCIAIEDAASGVQAATAAGVGVVVTVSEETRDQHFDGALLVVSDLGEPQAPSTWLAGAPLPAGHVRVADLERLPSAPAKGR